MLTALRALATRLRASPWSPVVLAAVATVVIAAGAVATCGRPQRVEERREATAEVHLVEAEQREEAREFVRHVETREERRPDGVVTIVRVEDEREASAATSTATATTDARAELREERIVERARPSWRVSAQAGWSLTRPTLRPELYGAEVSRRIVGPVWLGAWARTDRTAGLSLAMEW